MNNTIKHLSCGGFAVLPLPQAVAVQALASNNKCTGFGAFTDAILNAPAYKGPGYAIL